MRRGVVSTMAESELGGTDLMEPVKGRADVATVSLMLATVFALSPVLVDVWQQWIGFPWTRSSAVFAPLCVLLLWRAEREQPHRDGLAVLVLAIVATVLLVAGDRLAWARLLIPLAIIGLCRARGIADLRTALLCVFALPLPGLVNKWLAPALPEFVIGAATLPLRAVGAVVERTADQIAVSGHWLEFEPSDGGASLIFLFAGLGWAGAVAARAPLAKRVIGWSLCAIPVQAAIWALALVLLASLGAPPARAALDHLPALVAAALVIGCFALGHGTSRATLS